MAVRGCRLEYLSSSGSEHISYNNTIRHKMSELGVSTMTSPSRMKSPSVGLSAGGSGSVASCRRVTVQLPHSKIPLQLSSSLLHFSVEVAAHSLLQPVLLVEVSFPFLFGVTLNIQHYLVKWTTVRAEL